MSMLRTMTARTVRRIHNIDNTSDSSTQGQQVEQLRHRCDCLLEQVLDIRSSTRKEVLFEIYLVCREQSDGIDLVKIAQTDRLVADEADLPILPRSTLDVFDDLVREGGDRSVELPERLVLSERVGLPVEDS